MINELKQNMFLQMGYNPVRKYVPAIGAILAIRFNCNIFQIGIIFYRQNALKT